MRMCHEWETAEAAAWRQPARLGSVHIVQLPHCTTSTYHRIPHQAPCPWKLQLLFSMSMWAGKHDKVHVTCLNFPNCRWLVCCILQAVDSIRATSSILEKLQLPLIAISWNQTPKHVGLDSINSEHRADFVHSDFFWQSRPPNKPIKKGILAYP